tara:strand:+ start:146 stop:748 length:603 start_codon:yes stop_codon:yes gene_type:complete
MSLKLTTQKKQNYFYSQIRKYEKYTDRQYLYLETENKEFEILNYVFMECLINRYNELNTEKITQLKKWLFSYKGEKEDYKEAGFKLNDKDAIIRWYMRIPQSINLENKNDFIDPRDLRYFILDEGLVSEEEIEDNFYDVYVYPTFKKYINLMRDLKPFLRDIKDNTIICKNEEIFTIILLARNNKFTINYYAMKNILSYL